MSDMPISTAAPTVVTASTSQWSVTLVTVSADGTVCIDWQEVERQAAGRDPFMMPLAKALLSVRDKSYQPMSPR
jgi:hypothetical protein